MLRAASGTVVPLVDQCAASPAAVSIAVAAAKRAVARVPCSWVMHEGGWVLHAWVAERIGSIATPCWAKASSPRVFARRSILPHAAGSAVQAW